MFKLNLVSRLLEMIAVFIGMALLTFIFLGVPFCLKFTSLAQELPRLIYTTDPTAAANMYMVFSALLVAGLAMVLALSGVWISIVIAKQKEILVRENVDEIIRQLVSNDEYAKELVNAFSEKNPLRINVENVIIERTKELRQDVARNVAAQVEKRIDSLEVSVKQLAADRYRPEAAKIKNDLGDK